MTIFAMLPSLATPYLSLSPRAVGFWSLASFLILLLAVAVFVHLLLWRADSVMAIGAINGNAPLTVAQQRALLAVDFNPRYGMALDEVLNQAMSLDWVGFASVRRRLDGVLDVKVSPRVPVANFGSFQYIDASGKVFSPTDNSAPNGALTSLYGKDANALMHMMGQIGRWYAPLGLRTRELILSDDGLWLVRFENGFYITSDDDIEGKKLFLFSVALANGLADKKDHLAYADLRYQSGFAIKMKGQI